MNIGIRLLRNIDYNRKSDLNNKFRYKEADFDINKIITIRSVENYELKKASIMSFLFNNSKFPDNLQSNIYSQKIDKELTHVSSILRFEYVMEFGVDSIAYFIQPKIRNNKLLIFSSGHSNTSKDVNNILDFFLKKGYDVLRIDMPLKLNNSKPTVFIDNIGPLTIGHHDRFKFLEGKVNGHPLKFFIEPVFVFLNEIKSKNQYENISMLGFSGGGWTTIVSSAINKDINYSFIVSGPQPLIYKNPNKFDCYELSHKDFSNLVNYFDLYIMSAYGNKNGLFEVINIQERDHFSHESYFYPVKEALNQLGSGLYGVHIDEKNYQHSISNKSLDFVHRKIMELSNSTK
tara:strand:- start:1500 stop:2537 length:1038 start_codon:yes stop_codon:yes gene_type:complete